MIEIPDKPMTIREAAELTGLTEDTLRYYERIDLLPPAERRPNGHRFYTAGQVQGIVFLMKLKSIGMTLAQMRQFRKLSGEGCDLSAYE
ncbi:MerR family DNA-binding transcriptional regulator [Saccharibacillus deserti]|uniref:MerR family DNA-binding transcriptional regulator n=1 Tax=Saccharibacillus deserti TaxID=1634444 RepID=UPI00155197C9|nr:MerR family DNA-binding transcriptional regulator [Saccharibacillus deserti]